MPPMNFRNDAFRNPLALQDRYETPPGRRGWVSRLCGPTVGFYSRMMRVVFWSSYLATKGRYKDEEWVQSSRSMFDALEYAGCRFVIEGMHVLRALEGPAVFVANHMSTLETFVLPMLIHPVCRTTFVIKPSLMEYPVFGPVMRSRHPVVVSRDNPRQDLVTVLEDGGARLAEGTSIILFPQTTRTPDFDASAFNSLGVKLAQRAGVPLVPIALRSAAWCNGRWVKEFGPIHPNIPVRFRFFPALDSSRPAKDLHARVVEKIQGALEEWIREEPDSSRAR